MSGQLAGTLPLEERPPPLAGHPLPLPSSKVSRGASPFLLGRPGCLGGLSLLPLRRTHSPLMCSSRSLDMLAVAVAAVCRREMEGNAEGITSPIVWLEYSKVASIERPASGLPD